MVMGSIGSRPAGQANAALRASRIKELVRKPMTAKEMGLTHADMQLLKSRGFVRRLRHADKAHRIAVWTTGPDYRKLIDNWDRWC
jgi:hypothetical protein